MEFLEREIRDLQEELDSIEKRRHIFQGHVRHLEERAAIQGGEHNLSLADRTQLERVREVFEKLDLQMQDLQRQLVDRLDRLQRAQEVEALEKALDEAIEQENPSLVKSIAGQLKSLEPSRAETVDLKLTRYYWRAVIAMERTRNFDGCRQAWEQLEAHCYRTGDEEGLGNAREGLARLFEQQGDKEAREGGFTQAIHLYRQAYKKWCEVGTGEDALFAQQRVLGKQAQAYENLEQLEKALHCSYDRLELLTQMGRLQEAKPCYRQAIKLCARLSGPQRDDWEYRLTSLYVEWLKDLESPSEIQEIADLGRRENRPAIYEPATYALKDLSILIPQPLHLRERHRSPPGEPSRDLTIRQRCADLDKLIAEAQKLLREFEELRLLADDPKKKLRLERQIADLKAQMKDYEAEYQELQCHELEGR